MKIILSILISSLYVASVWAYSIRVTDGNIETNKYTLNGSPVWTDTERAAIIASAVDTGTGTVRNGDFTTESVPAEDQSIIDQLNTEKSKRTRTKVMSEISRRKSQVFKDQQEKEAALDEVARERIGR